MFFKPAEDLTRAEVKARKDAWKFLSFWREHLPAYESCRIVRMATHVGSRETRRIIGEYVLTEEDVLHGRRFHDAVAQGGWSV